MNILADDIVRMYGIGGGFTVAANPLHFEFHYNQIIKPLNATGDDNIAFLFVEYTLTPYATYPTQFRQTVEALRHVLKDTNRSPSSVVLGGDSAGGNLATATLLHLSHPHPDIEPIDLRPGEKLRGTFACSPWVSLHLDWPSARENRFKDIIEPACLDLWSSVYLRGGPGDCWSEPLLAPVDWWKDVRADRVLFSAGSDEIFLSAIDCFVKKFKVSLWLVCGWLLYAVARWNGYFRSAFIIMVPYGVLADCLLPCCRR